jgi:hypothetical protein
VPGVVGLGEDSTDDEREDDDALEEYEGDGGGERLVGDAVEAGLTGGKIRFPLGATTETWLMSKWFMRAWKSARGTPQQL